MDIITTPEQNGKTTILKHFSSMAGSRIPWELAASLCTGESRVLDLRGMVPKVAMKALELMKDKLGGAQLRNFLLTSIVAPPHPPVAPSHKDPGYDFIEKHCPVEGTEMDRARWVARQVGDERSPIYAWPKNDVEEAIAAMRMEGCTVKTISYLPVTLMDVSKTMRDILKQVIPGLKSHSVVMVGRPGFGKTPFLQALSMAMSKYYMDSPKYETKLTPPCFRTTESLDFVRTAPGLLERPDLFDDGDMNTQPTAAPKAFLDVSKTEGGLCMHDGVLPNLCSINFVELVIARCSRVQSQKLNSETTRHSHRTNSLACYNPASPQMRQRLTLIPFSSEPRGS